MQPAPGRFGIVDRSIHTTEIVLSATWHPDSKLSPIRGRLGLTGVIIPFDGGVTAASGRPSLGCVARLCVPPHRQVDLGGLRLADSPQQVLFNPEAVSLEACHDGALVARVPGQREGKHAAIPS